LSGQGPEAAGMLQRMLANTSVAPAYPHFRSMRAGPDNTMLVQRYRTVSEMEQGPEGLTMQALQAGSADWDVFDSDGRYAGVVRFPDRFRPLAVRGNAILGTETDSDGVESIVLLRASGAE